MLLVEYPSYGTYNDTKGTNTQILSDSKSVYKYLVYIAGILPKNIMLLGNSMGCAIVNYIASNYSQNSDSKLQKNEKNDGGQLKCVINISPFCSIKDIIKQSSTFGSYFVDEYIFLVNYF